MSDCTQMRRMVIRRGTMDLATGTSTLDEGTVETRACGTPLFSDQERKTGICRSCASGWTHPNNYPVESDA